ncbi:AbrB family transcriptional regulator [Cohnella panacarvi]|uniref:AbrB family transcriptional regulator n=1 Tax=Cohnella panacarvi TaxID=400776 RepID=UPI00047D7D93|nr:AbrB family transcriptional regulator [Cohnella panacarvi]
MSAPRTTNRTAAFALTLVIAIVSALLFTLIRMPIPWLLGPMIGVCAAARIVRSYTFYWPGFVRNAGLITVGYAIGTAFTRDTLTEIVRQLPSMVLMTFMLLFLCALLAYGVSKAAGIPYATALTGSIPGGLSQMVTLAEETKGIDLTVVTFLQVSRLMMIIVFIPIIVFSPGLDPASSGSTAAAVAEAVSSHRSWSGLWPHIVLYGAVCTVLSLLASKINFPTAYLLPPLIATAALHLGGLTAPELPSPVLAAAQLMIGCYVGLLLKPENLPNKPKLITVAVLSGIALIAGSCGLSYLLTRLHAMTAATSLLSLAPGGMDQMGIIAHEIDANVSIVSCYQLFRTFFIFLAVPPLLKTLFRRFR